MDDLEKKEDVKDLLTLIIETNILGIDFEKHLEVLLQNIENLKDNTYSKRIETYHLSFLLISLKKKIEEIINKGEVQQNVNLFKTTKDGELIISVGRSYEDKINDDLKDQLTQIADKVIKSIRELKNEKNLHTDSEGNSNI